MGRLRGEPEVCVDSVVGQQVQLVGQEPNQKGISRRQVWAGRWPGEDR